jgi:hypothetical protein
VSSPPRTLYYCRSAVRRTPHHIPVYRYTFIFCNLSISSLQLLTCRLVYTCIDYWYSYINYCNNNTVLSIALSSLLISNASTSAVRSSPIVPNKYRYTQARHKAQKRPDELRSSSANLLGEHLSEWLVLKAMKMERLTPKSCQNWPFPVRQTTNNIRYSLVAFSWKRQSNHFSTSLFKTQKSAWVACWGKEAFQ